VLLVVLVVVDVVELCDVDVLEVEDGAETTAA